MQAKLEMDFERKQRLARALSENMYLLSVFKIGQAWWFIVRGGKTYRVMLVNRAFTCNFDKRSCTCPDYHGRGMVCKHMLFLAAKIARKPHISALSDAETFDSDFFTAVKQLLDKKNRLLVPGDGHCLICSDEQRQTTWNCVHCKNSSCCMDCIHNWFTRCLFNQNILTCPHCRADVSQAVPRRPLLHESLRDPFLFFMGFVREMDKDCLKI